MRLLVNILLPCPSAPPILVAIYFWYAVYSTFHQLRQEEETRRSNSHQSIGRDDERVRALLAHHRNPEIQPVNPLLQSGFKNLIHLRLIGTF